MPEQNQITFSYKELAEALVRYAGIHEGLWGVYIEFGLSAANVSTTPGSGIAPAAIIPVTKIGIQRFNEENNLTIDATKKNPTKKNESQQKE